ncbi:hypothetical protein CsSME_00015087 [Camellia sinensis var. sinensis]
MGRSSSLSSSESEESPMAVEEPPGSVAWPVGPEKKKGYVITKVNVRSPRKQCKIFLSMDTFRSLFLFGEARASATDAATSWAALSLEQVVRTCRADLRGSNLLQTGEASPR